MPPALDAVAALKASPLFSGFTDTGLTILAGITAPHAYPVGTPLFVENMVSDFMLIIVDGTVRLSAKDKGGGDVTLTDLGPGDYLGELSLISTGQRMCTATAVTNVQALEIRQADFQKMLGVKPQACMKLMMGIVTRFGQRVVDNREALRTLLRP